MNNSQKFIIVKGAKENNLKNINVSIPKNKLVVFTGVSGSGKSSLAFNTIYEEGRRRYVDSLSSYARQFLGGTQKPLVDSIDGLSPAISIEQKSTHNNPRSTVGTVTEIYDYLRLLYARIGKVYCPNGHGLIPAQTTKDIFDDIYKNPLGSKLNIFSPIIKNEKGSHQNLFAKLRSEGFLRVRINHQMHSIEDEKTIISLNKNKRHDIDIVIDRIVLREDEKARVSEAIELALEHGKGFMAVENLDTKEVKNYSKYHSCRQCGFNMVQIEPRLFSFNAPLGMCDGCKGLGIKLIVDINKLIPNFKLSIRQGGIKFFENLVMTLNLDWQEFAKLLDYYGISIETPLKDLTKDDLNIILNGSQEKINYHLTSRSGRRQEKFDYIEGLVEKIERRFLNSTSEVIRNWYKHAFMSDSECDVCHGARLNRAALSVKINNLNIFELTNKPIDETLQFIVELNLSDEERKIATLIINELHDRLTFLNDVGLEYLALSRKAETLSGGESQRIRLATQIGSNLTGVLYVLDEPSIGLHQKDNEKLIKTLQKMVDIGNTLIVVEHDEETIRMADWIVDIGPWAGDKGGQVVAQGSVDEITNHDNSITGAFLKGTEVISIPKFRRSGNGKVIEIKGAKENNLKNINVKFPLGKIIAVTGVSGSGKSTLVNEVFAKGLMQKLSNPFIKPGKFNQIKGIENIDKVVQISQSPIGRTPRSNPATYTSVFDDIRDVFAKTQVARARSYQKGRFSFNVPGGRCDKCEGDGLIKIEMHFLPDVYVECDNCQGKRYNFETLEAKYKNKSIADVLDMRVSEALIFFANNPKIKHKLQTVEDVGLGYIKLGQNATTLSGGEAQRVKLATFLQRKPTGKTIYILDEPTTGLHQYDVRKLITILERLVSGGDTVLVIEHNLDIIKSADYIIDLGLGGGINGGKIVAHGTPEQVATSSTSHTAKYLKEILDEKTN